MAALYSVDAHALLSGKVRKLESAEFTANELLAESLLELNSPALTNATAVERIQLAIVSQMNFQVAQGIDPLIRSAETRGGSIRESAAYRDRWLNPVAFQLVASAYGLLGIDRFADRYAVLTSHRTQ